MLAAPALLLCLAPGLSPQQSSRLALDKAADAVVASLGKRSWSGVSDLLAPGGSLVVYYTGTDYRQTFKSFSQAVKSKRRLAWLPPMEGDGGMREAYRATLPSFLGDVARNNWRKARRSYDKSADVTYRTLLVSDLQKKHPKLRWVDLVLTDPAVPETREYAASLTLGFASQKGGGYRLSVLGYDHWKD